MTIRHFKKHAPYIKIDIIDRVSDFLGLLENEGVLADYDVLLLDYRLPQENALELLKRINETSSRIPVVLITGKGDEEIAVQALKIGAFDYITKNYGYLHKLPSAIENAYYSMRLKREHQALLESEQRYRVLFEENQTIMLVIDPEIGKVVDANPAAIRFYGWSREELKGKPITEINTLAWEELQTKLNSITVGDQAKFFFKHRLADGSVRDVEVHSGPVEVGGQPFLYSMIYDITEHLKEQQEKEWLQRQLIQAQKMESFGQLAGGIAHDFNNILASIIGFTELALDDVETESSIYESLQEVYSAGKRAKDLVSQILAFARQSDEKMQLVKIADTVTEVLKLIRSTTPANIAIQQEIDTASHIMGNAIQIHQIIMNLCTNAVHAMQNSGGVLKIGLSDIMVDESPEFADLKLKQGRYIKMTVSDTGTGIPNEIIGSIFEPYFTTKLSGEGTGMGLAVVYGIVESYSGKVTVRSEMNSGTVFSIYLPVSNASYFQQTYKSEPLPRGNEKILFVDDDAGIVKMGVQILHRLGYRVTPSNSSVEALEIFRSNPGHFDLVITDMTMPIITGDQLAEKLIKIKPDIPLILFTGYSKKISAETASRFGVKAFAYKPIVKEKLAKMVRDVLDEAGMNQLQ